MNRLNAWRTTSTLIETDETVLLQLSNPTGTTWVSPGNAVLTIQDCDLPQLVIQPVAVGGQFHVTKSVGGSNQFFRRHR